MKINNNFSINKINNNISINKKITANPKIEQIEQPKINAQYYRANYGVAFKGQTEPIQYNNIYFPIYDKNNKLKQLNVLIPDENEKTLPLILKDKYLEFVLDEKGEINSKKLNNFSTLYKKFFHEKQNEFLKDAERFSSFAEKIEEEIDLGIDEDSDKYDTFGMSDEEVLEILPDSKRGRILKEKMHFEDFAKQAREKAKPQNVIPLAMELSKSFLSLMEKTNNHDLSFVDKNIKLMKEIDKVQDSSVGNRFDLYEELIKKSYKYKNDFDMDFMGKITEVMSYCSMGFDIKSFNETATVVYDILSIDKDKEDVIYDGFLKFVKTYQAADKYTKNMFENSFNPVTKQFDENSLKTLIDVAKEIVEITFSDNVLYKNTYEECSFAEQEIIKDYFNFVRDEKTGELTEKKVDIQTFASSRLSKYLKI